MQLLQPQLGRNSRQPQAPTRTDRTVAVAACDINRAEQIANAFDTVLCCGVKHTIVHPHHFGQYFIDRTDGIWAPRRDQIEHLLDYAQTHPGRVLCYCQQGRSRSTAVAIGVAILQGTAPRDARQAVIHQGVFTPNPLILAHIASILGCNLTDITA